MLYLDTHLRDRALGTADWTLTEFPSALGIKQRMGLIDGRRADRAWADLMIQCAETFSCCASIERPSALPPKSFGAARPVFGEEMPFTSRWPVARRSRPS